MDMFVSYSAVPLRLVGIRYGDSLVGDRSGNICEDTLPFPLGLCAFLFDMGESPDFIANKL